MIEKQMTLLWEVTFWEFVFVTIVLAGAGAFLTGRAVARTWQGNGTLVAYMLLLAAATRFIHFALFHGSLLSLHYYAVDLVILLVLGFAGKRYTRGRQMERQYSFEYRKTGPLSWARKP